MFSTLIDLVIDHITERVSDIESDYLLKCMQIFFPVNEAERADYGEDTCRLNEVRDHDSVVLERSGFDIEHLKQAE